MTKLTTAARKKLPKLAFALPGGRYPVEDNAHARDAKARGSAAQRRLRGQSIPIAARQPASPTF